MHIYAELGEKILQLLRQSPEPLRINEIGKALSIPSSGEKHEELKAALAQLVESEVVVKLPRRKFGLASAPGEKSTTFKGIFVFHRNVGFVETNSKEIPRIFVKRENMNTALDGDQVEVQLLARRRNRKAEGEVIAVLERRQAPMSGTVELDGNFYFFLPDDEKFFVDFLIHEKMLNGAKNGDKVIVQFSRWDNPNKAPEVEVLEVIGESGIPTVEFDTIIREFNLPPDFPKKVEEEAIRVAVLPPEHELESRLDLRDMDIITIDPEDAKDFDDALSLEMTEEGNYRLGVHIADVSHYVQEGSELDKEALKRGNSIYLVDRVVPMLPHSLSSNICSLRPNEDRLAYTVFMEFSPRGALKDYEIFESVIRSKRRFTYAEAQEIIDTGKGDYSELMLSLFKVAEILRKKRYKTGGIDFETSEIKFILDENKNPVRAVVKTRTDSTGLVEECMLAANQTVAEHVKALSKQHRMGKELLPFLYRVHDKPDAEKMYNAIAFIRSLGVKVDIKGLSSKEINEILLRVEELPEKKMIHQVLLRSQAKAIYSYYNIGHFGLGFKDYSHFTSPIRRYPDLVIHRLLKEYAQGKVKKERLKQLHNLVSEVDDHCSLTERQAVEAERASIKLAQAHLALQHINKEFNGTVTGVTNFGLFVSIDDLYVEGLLHIRDMYDDYYFFDERNFRLVGKRRKRVYGFGARLRVQITNVNLVKRVIDFKYVGRAMEQDEEDIREIRPDGDEE